jgi:hypothetical protein
MSKSNDVWGFNVARQDKKKDDYDDTSNSSSSSGDDDDDLMGFFKVGHVVPSF